MEPSHRQVFSSRIISMVACLFLLTGGMWLEKGKGVPATPGLVPVDTSTFRRDESDLLKRETAPGRLLVTVREGVDPRDFMTRMVAKHQGRFTFVGYQPEIGLLQVACPAEETAAITDLLAGEGEVEGVGPEVRFQAPFVPDDPAFHEPRDPSSRHAKDWGLRAIRAFDAWDTTRGRDEVLIAVVDAGFAPHHPEFQGRNVRAMTWDGGGELVRTGGNCDAGHGTHVAAIAAASAGNGSGGAGVCPQCGLLMIQVGDAQGRIPASQAVAGMLLAVNSGAKVINKSLGSLGDAQSREFLALDPGQRQAFLDESLRQQRREAAIYDRVARFAASRGVVLVVAAGNEGVPMILDPSKRAEGPIYVAATDEDGSLTPFSNHGPEVTVSAPGVQVFSAIPEQGYALCDGTSMSSPFVAGAVALLRSAHPGLSPEEIKRLLVTTGTRVVTDKTVGPQINLAAALAGTTRPDPGASCDCQALRRRIADLERQLQQTAPTPAADTTPPPAEEQLTLPLIPPTDFQFAAGSWRASSPLYRDRDQARVALVFRITRSGAGNVTYEVTSANHCSAPVEVTFRDNMLVMRQLALAPCPGDQSAFNLYLFSCKADFNQVAHCRATLAGEETGMVGFTMIRE